MFRLLAYLFECCRSMGIRDYKVICPEMPGKKSKVTP